MGNLKRVAINVFIAFHAVLLCLWGLPDSMFVARITAPFRSYVLYSGLWHIWSMFAPSPYSLNYDLRANVEFKDGSTQEWVWPRMHEMSYWERLPKERFRKWRELMFTDTYRHLWASNARFVARQVDQNGTNRPVRVTLTRFWKEIPPPNLQQDYQPPIKSFTPDASYTFAVVPISAGDLK